MLTCFQLGDVGVACLLVLHRSTPLRELVVVWWQKPSSCFPGSGQLSFFCSNPDAAATSTAFFCPRLCGRKGGGARPCVVEAQDIGGLLRLRHNMGHVITNLQLYLQLDVIESNFDWLQQQLAAAQVGGVVTCTGYARQPKQAAGWWLEQHHVKCCIDAQ